MTRLLTILLLAPVLALAQYKPESKIEYHDDIVMPATTYFNVGKLEVLTPSGAQNYLEENDWIDPEYSSLVLLDAIESPVGWHFNYKQQLNGFDIYGGGLKINIGKDGRIRSIVDNIVKIDRPIRSHFPAFDSKLNGDKNRTSSHVYVRMDAYFLPCIRVEVKIGKDNIHYEQFMLNEEIVLFRLDMNRYLMSDSTVSAKVFLPDPLTTSGKVYGGAYSDNSDIDNTELNLERFDVNMVVDFTNDTFRLSSPLVEIQEFSNPNTVPVTGLTADYDYTRSQDQFEEVNCFYHLTTFQNYMQSLGFNLVNYQLGVDVHALNGADNSMFSYPKLYFGDGCVDDAEDADVIIHEYGHAITASAAPNTWVGSERKALDEAAGDYLATSYTRTLNPFNWQFMFGWDGNNACWPGRTAATTKQYPGGLTGDTHKDGEIWSSTLMQIWEVLGRETTDQLFLQSLYSYAQNMSMTDAAYMFLDADSMLNGGANYVTSYYWFEKRGILPPLPFFAGADGNGEMSTCNGDCDASAVVIPMGGTAPYTYAWKDSLGAALGQATDTVTGLCAGNYSVFITDASGDTATVNIQAREPDALGSTINTSVLSCSFCGDGMASAVVSGGTQPFSYQWDDSMSQATKTAMSLDSGMYSVAIIDANGCSYADNGLVGVDTSVALGVIFTSSTDPTCNTPCQGSIQAMAYGGLPPYTYLWSDSLSQTTSQASNLCVGNYILVVLDANGDNKADSMSLTESVGMSYNIFTLPDSGGGEGTASVFVTNGVSPLTYTWNDSQAQTTSLATGLVAGVYTVNWVDSIGCTGTATDTVELFISVHNVEKGFISVFPNPSDGVIFISSEHQPGPLLIQVTNAIGQPVYMQTLDNKAPIDISSHGAGLYHILISFEGSILHHEKLILH